jgi:hypothetical protein
VSRDEESRMTYQGILMSENLSRRLKKASCTRLHGDNHFYENESDFRKHYNQLMLSIRLRVSFTTGHVYRQSTVLNRAPTDLSTVPTTA